MFDSDFARIGWPINFVRGQDEILISFAIFMIDWNRLEEVEMFPIFSAYQGPKHAC